MALFRDEDRGGDAREQRDDVGLAAPEEQVHDRRWRTDNGDPFGDRAARTPMRVIRGRFRRGAAE